MKFDLAIFVLISAFFTNALAMSDLICRTENRISSVGVSLYQDGPEAFAIAAGAITAGSKSTQSLEYWSSGDISAATFANVKKLTRAATLEHFKFPQSIVAKSTSGRKINYVFSRQADGKVRVAISDWFNGVKYRSIKLVDCLPRDR